jgi:hypothetical protein
MWRVIALAAALLPSLMGGQSHALSQPIPDGWYVYPEEKLKDLDETTLRCFNYSQNEWQVMTDGNGIRITKRVAQKKGALPSGTQLPPLLKHEEGMPGRTVYAGLRSATHFSNGWLLAYDAGEWGGGLWITNEDGSEVKRLVNDNVHAVVPIDDGVLVLSGLAHLSLDFGNAFIFSNPNGLNISLRRTAHLDGEPRAYAKESDGSVLFVTTHGLRRITKSGDVQDLVGLPDWMRNQYANSMAITSDGSIFIGMRMFVLKLHIDEGQYKEEWLLPQECRKFHLAKFDCPCKP